MTDQSTVAGAGVDSHWEGVGLVSARVQWALKVPRVGTVKSSMILEVTG